MKRLIATAAFGLGVLALAGGATAGSLTEAGELEHARANARAGGPVSERDAEFLERWGCLSGTRNAFCQRIENRERYRSHRRYAR